MGYRYYFRKAKKPLVEAIQNCKTNEGLLETAEHFRSESVEDDYVFLPHIFDQLIEFGKYYENANELYKIGEPLFRTEELAKQYDDYGVQVYFGDQAKKAILSCIEWQKDRIKNNATSDIQKTGEFEKLFVTDTGAWLVSEGTNSIMIDKDKARELVEFLADIRMEKRWEQYGYYDINLEHQILTDSWQYRDTIFNLLHIYKTFDYENDALIFMGW